MNNERSWEDRIVHFPSAIGETSIGFDHEALDAAASAAERLADDLMAASGPAGMTPRLALHAAKFFLTHLSPFTAGQKKQNIGAMDSLLQADTEQLLKQVIDRIFEAPKPRLSVGCLKLALGMVHADLKSQRHWAEKQQVSIEHVSNEVAAWQTLLCLPMTSAQKSEAAKDSYALRNKQKKAA